MTKRIFALLFLCTQVSLLVYAQNLQVKSFSLDETDITANLTTTHVIDPSSGKKCALIKIHSILKELSFDTGRIGIVKTEFQNDNHPAEIWLYVPTGLKQISISHPRYSPLKEFDFGMAVQSAKTYHLFLTSGTLQTHVKKTLDKQYAFFKIKPKTAKLVVNGVEWDLSSNSRYFGMASRLLPYGTYEYHISAPEYQESAGIFHLDKEKFIETVILEPLRSSLSITSEPLGATIAVYRDSIWNDILIDYKDTLGVTPLQLNNFPTGEHIIYSSLKGYYSDTSEVVVTSSGKNSLRIMMKKQDKQRAQLQVIPPYAHLEVNGKPWRIVAYKDGIGFAKPTMLKCGEYKYRVTAPGFKDLEGFFNIDNEQAFEQTIKLDTIVGFVNITSSPEGSNVLIEKENSYSYSIKKKTPIMQEHFPAGSWKLICMHQDFWNDTIDVDVIEGKTENLSFVLQKRRETIDEVKPGDSKSEKSHKVLFTQNSQTGTYLGGDFRDEKRGGFVEYTLFNPQQVSDSLVITVRLTTYDKLRQALVTIDGSEIYKIQDSYTGHLDENGFKNLDIPIPASLLRNYDGSVKKQFKIRVTGLDGKPIPGIYGMRLASIKPKNR